MSTSESKRYKEDNDDSDEGNNAIDSIISASNSLLSDEVQESLEQCRKDGLENHTVYLNFADITDAMVPAICEYLDNFEGMLELGGNKLSSNGVILLLNECKKRNARLKEIRLDNNKIDDVAMIELGKYIKDMNCVEELDISYNKITDNGIITIAPFLENNISLATLLLGSNNNITDKSVPVLLKILETSRVSKLKFEDTGIEQGNRLNDALTINATRYLNKDVILDSGVDDVVIEKICDGMKTYGVDKVKSIRIHGGNITSKGTMKFLETLTECNTIITNLDMGSCEFDDGCLKLLGKFIQNNQHLKKLRLDSESITDKSIEILMPYFVGNTILHKFELDRYVNITGDVFPYLSKIIEESRVVDFGNENDFVADEISQFATLFAINYLKYETKRLDLERLGINDENIIPICEAMKKIGCYKFQEFDFSNNKMTSKGAIVLLNTLKEINPPINFLSLKDNNFDDGMIESLGEFIESNCTLEKIDLGISVCNNKLTDEGIKKLSKHLIGNTSLKYLGIYDNQEITEKALPYLAEIVKKSCITVIDMRGVISYRAENEIKELCEIPVDQREIPVKSNSKSAAKRSCI